MATDVKQPTNGSDLQDPDSPFGIGDEEQRRAERDAADVEATSDRGQIDAAKGRTMAQRAADAASEPTEPDGPEELFPTGSVEGDSKITLKNIVTGGTARKIQAKMSGTAVPMTEGLVKYGERRELLVTVEAGAVKEVPELAEEDSSGHRKLLGVKNVQEFRPLHTRSAADMFTRDQVLDILTEVGIPASSNRARELVGLPPA